MTQTRHRHGSLYLDTLQVGADGQQAGVCLFQFGYGGVDIEQANMADDQSLGTGGLGDTADHRGRGVGKLLMPPLIDGARQRGFHAIIGVIDAANEASIRLHASFGFERVGLFQEVGFKFGRWLDVAYMQLLLPRDLPA